MDAEKFEKHAEVKQGVGVKAEASVLTRARFPSEPGMDSKIFKSLSLIISLLSPSTRESHLQSALSSLILIHNNLLLSVPLIARVLRGLCIRNKISNGADNP